MDIPRQDPPMIIGSGGGDTPWTFKRVWEDLQARWAHGTIIEKMIIIGIAIALVMFVAGVVAMKLQEDQVMPPRDKKIAQEMKENGGVAPSAAEDTKTTEEEKAEEQAKQQAQAGNGSAKTGGGGSSGSGSGGGSSGGSSSGGSGNTNSGECAPYPSFPDANCTGPSGNLPLYTGSTAFYDSGTVIENVEIRTDDIYVAGDNITFRNVKIVYTGALDASFTIVNIATGATGTVFEDCEIDGQSKVARAIKGPSDVTVRNCEIHHTANAVEVGTSFAVYDSYIHDIFTPDGQDWHADGIQSAESVSNITIKHNTILLTGGETGAINIIGDSGPGDTISNVLVEHNLMAGGGYTVYSGANGGTNNYRVINNHFSTRYHSKVGVFNIWYPNLLSSVTRSGNVIHETGASANNNL